MAYVYLYTLPKKMDEIVSFFFTKKPFIGIGKI